MRSSDLALVQEVADTRATLGAWNERPGPVVARWLLGALAFSLITQAYVLGNGAASLAARLGVTPAVLLAGRLPHALPELVALFLPLAAWMIAGRQSDWHQLLAATFVTVPLAVPVVLAAAFVEVYVSPGVLQALAG